MDIVDWLRGLGLLQYAQSFADNGVDAEVLQQLTADDLKELGIAPLGHRRKLLTAIEGLRAPAAATAFSGAREHADPPESPAVSSPQRRHLTVLFCDLVGSTALSARLDPEDLREVIRRYHAVVAETVRSQGGFVAQYLGDGALVYFGFPAAHEDDAERAVRAALLVRDAAQSIKVKGNSLRVRAGLATGLVVVGDRARGSTASHEPQVMGETPNRAARLQALAEPGGIVIDAATRKLVGRMFALGERAAANLKGFEAAVECWEVVGEAAIGSRFEALRSGETPLIGRDEEIELLVKRWGQVTDGGGRIVLLSGEPGLGKSRLVSALEERIRTDRSEELRYFCSPQHTSTALHPIITNLVQAANFADDDTTDQKLEKLRAIITNPAHLAPVADLLSLPLAPHAGLEELAPEERRQKLFAALLARIEALAMNGPLFILFEDTHWVDPTTQELIDLLIPKVGELPILLILTFRSEFPAPWVGQPNVTTLALTRLRSEDCAALVNILTANGNLPSEIVEEIAERADGIPLFAEELSSALMEANKKGSARNTVSAAELHVPDSLHASLLARLDHLGAEARETAQAGSVIGREFPHSLLIRMAARCGILNATAIDAALDALVGSGLVFTRGTAPDVVYTFKHALVQDAAYSTLLRTQRLELHAALASLLQEDAGIAPEVLAYHFAGAGQPEKAAEQWFKAGQAANERSAHLEAIRSFQNALDIISSLPTTGEREFRTLEITGAMCSPMIAAKWLMSESTDLINKAAQIAAKLGVSPPAAVLYHQAIHHIGSSNHKEAVRLLTLFREAAGTALQTRAETSLSTAIYMSGGSLEKALEHNSKGLSVYDRKAHSKQRFQFTYEPRCVALSTESLQLTLRGYFEQAKLAEREALAYAAEFNHPQTTGHLLAYKLLRGEFQEDYSEQVETAQALSQHADEHKVVFLSLWTNIFTGFAAARAGHALEGIETIDKSLQVFASMKFTYYRPYHLGLKARAYQIAGDLENALLAVSEGIALANETGEKAVLADLIRISGELRLAQSAGLAIEAAEALFREAIALAQAQASRLHELRAAVSLARLWRRQDRDVQARALLQPIYDWFTEGLSAPDLVRARALLSDMSASRQHENA